LYDAYLYEEKAVRQKYDAYLKKHEKDGACTLNDFINIQNMPNGISKDRAVRAISRRSHIEILWRLIEYLFKIHRVVRLTFLHSSVISKNTLHSFNFKFKQYRHIWY
jgi:hypothetical protein